MEAYGLILAIIIIIWAIFRKSIRRIASYSEDMVTVNVAEGNVELIERTNLLADRLQQIGTYRVADLDRLLAAQNIPNGGDKKNKQQQ